MVSASCKFCAGVSILPRTCDVGYNRCRSSGKGRIIIREMVSFVVMVFYVPTAKSYCSFVERLQDVPNHRMFIGSAQLSSFGR